MELYLVPCNHFWLAVKYEGDRVIAICKHYGCRMRQDFPTLVWEGMKAQQCALDKPVRI